MDKDGLSLELFVRVFLVLFSISVDVPVSAGKFHVKPLSLHRFQ